jgi:CRISPR-associated protein Cas2
MAEQFILVAYDISDDKRRTRLHNALLDYGTPVQYSVFECLLEKKEERKMRAAVQRTIKPTKDHVRFYYLCASCLRKVETTGKREILSDLPPAVIVG